MTERERSRLIEDFDKMKPVIELEWYNGYRCAINDVIRYIESIEIKEEIE